MLAELNGRKAYCEDGIKNMSVTLYTNRSQNQYKGYVKNLDDIDRALNVFDRDKVFVAPWIFNSVSDELLTWNINKR